MFFFCDIVIMMNIRKSLKKIPVCSDKYLQWSCRTQGINNGVGYLFSIFYFLFFIVIIIAVQTKRKILQFLFMVYNVEAL